MDYEKLVEQMKWWAEECDRTNFGCQAKKTLQEAANALSMLQAENEKLRAELERMKVERDAYQVYFKDLSSKPDCNTCEKRSCEYKPRPGAIVRVNCPLYSGPEKEDPQWIALYAEHGSEALDTQKYAQLANAR